LNDVLSDVLRAVRLTGAVFWSVEATDPWASQSPPAHVIAPLIRPGIEHVIQFHAIVSGRCWGGLNDEPAIELRAGDLMILPHGDQHGMSSRIGLKGGVVSVKLDPSSRPALPLPLSMGPDAASGEKTRFICGYLGCDAGPFNPLLAALPRLLHISGATQRIPLLSQLIEMALTESRFSSAGREIALSRLSELMFVEAIRDYVASAPKTSGWLAGLSDDMVGRALTALHARTAHAWTIDSLAREIGTSRSVLAERFSCIMGVPPMQYLTQWRMQIASDLLSSTSAGLGEIAFRVGYGSDTALSHAFKRTVGISPAQFRNGERAAPEARPELSMLRAPLSRDATSGSAL
jgi:AraC-like DNA-binding protein